MLKYPAKIETLDGHITTKEENKPCRDKILSYHSGACTKIFLN